MLLYRNILSFQPLRLFCAMVASEHPIGEKPVRDIHWFPSLLIRGDHSIFYMYMCCSAKGGGGGGACTISILSLSLSP